MGIVAPTTA